MPIPIKYIDSYDNVIELTDNDEFIIVHNNKVYNVSGAVIASFIKNSPNAYANASTSQKGIVQLSNAINSTATTMAATPKAVKTAYDKAASVETTITNNTAQWNDKYTKSEIDNKFATLETNIDWKESVATYTDIATTYSNPQDGWTVNVQDTDYTYRFNGTKWVVISANAIPNATGTVAGLMTPEDKNKLDQMSLAGNQYIHPSYTSRESNLYKITVDSQGHVSAVSQVTKSDITSLGIPSSDTHYSSNNVVAKNESATVDTMTALKNGEVHLNHIENGVVTSYHKITGAGNTTVTTDVNGNIIISSTGSGGGDGSSVQFTPIQTVGTKIGTLSIDGTEYDLYVPNYTAATSAAFGLVKVGSNITNESGSISLKAKNVTDALGYIPPRIYTSNPASMNDNDIWYETY